MVTLCFARPPLRAVALTMIVMRAPNVDVGIFFPEEIVELRGSLILSCSRRVTPHFDQCHHILAAMLDTYDRAKHRSFPIPFGEFDSSLFEAIGISGEVWN